MQTPNLFEPAVNAAYRVFFLLKMSCIVPPSSTNQYSDERQTTCQGM